MRRTVFAAVLLSGLGVPALAADLAQPYPTTATYPTTAALAGPAWTWTGCYVGAQAGGLWGESAKWIVRTPGGDFQGQSLGKHQVDGAIGGVQAGCDYGFANVVAGLQADIGWADARGSHKSAQEFGVSYHSEVEWIASVTGRIGRPFDRFLPYVKGGVAWERDRYSASTIVTGTAYRATDTRPGWTVGIGGEYAVSRTVSVFLEDDYYDFGTKKVRMKPVIDGLNPAFVAIEETASIVKAGLNVRF